MPNLVDLSATRAYTTHQWSGAVAQSEGQIFRSHFGAILDKAKDLGRVRVNVASMSRQRGLISMSYRPLSCCFLLPLPLPLPFLHPQGPEASRKFSKKKLSVYPRLLPQLLYNPYIPHPWSVGCSWLLDVQDHAWDDKTTLDSIKPSQLSSVSRQ